MAARKHQRIASRKATKSLKKSAAKKPTDPAQGGDEGDTSRPGKRRAWNWASEQTAWLTGDFATLEEFARSRNAENPSRYPMPGFYEKVRTASSRSKKAGELSWVEQKAAIDQAALRMSVARFAAGKAKRTNDAQNGFERLGLSIMAYIARQMNARHAWVEENPDAFAAAQAGPLSAKELERMAGSMNKAFGTVMGSLGVGQPDDSEGRERVRYVVHINNAGMPVMGPAKRLAAPADYREQLSEILGQTYEPSETSDS